MAAMGRVQLWVIILFLCLTAGPAMAGVVMIPIIVPMPPPTVPQADSGGYDNVHTVAVVSSLGASMTLQYHDFWGEHSKPFDISTWDVDGKVEALLKQYLDGRFAFKDVAYDKAKLAAIPNGPFVNTEADVSKYLRGLDNDGVDAFLVVRPDLNQQLPGTEGIGLDNGGAFNDPLPVEWANYEVEFFDAHSYKKIASAYSRLSLRKGEKPSFAGIVTTDILKLDRDLEPKPEQVTVLKIVTDQLVTKSLIETLRVMDLGVALPEPGARQLVPIPADKMPYAKIKTVAVASNIGDAFDFEYIATIFDRTTHATPVPNWQIDKNADDEARTTLAKHFTVVDANVDLAAFANAQVLDKDGKFDPKFPGLTARDDVDAYVLLIKYRAPVWEKIEGEGVGLFQNEVANVTAVFAKYAVLLVDAHTLKVVVSRSAVTSPNYLQPEPFVPIDDKLWPKNTANMTQDEANALESILRPLVADTVDETLLSMGLTGMMIDREPPAAPAASASLDEPTAPQPSSNSSPATPHEGARTGGGH